MLLTLSLMIVIGFVVSDLSARMRIPRIVGMLFAGIVIGPFVLDWIAPEVLAISKDLRQIALIVILLRAGLSLDLKDLKKVGRQAVYLSFIPASIEMLGALILGPWLLGLTLLESAILGSILAAVSPAIIVPKMLTMIKERHGTTRRIPQMIMAGASVDDIFVIVIFTSLIQLAQGEGFSLGVLLNLPIALVLGVTVGVLTGWMMERFYRKYRVRDTAKVLVILSFGLFFLVFEQTNVVPFSGLLATMVLGITLLMRYPVLAQRLVGKYEKIWVFSELMLFVLVGAAVDITTIPSIGLSALLMVLGLMMFRSLGVIIATNTSVLTLKERLFTVIAYIPKATVQASIGSIPLALGLSSGNTMLTVSVLAILITAPVGSFLIDATKRRLIDEVDVEPTWIQAKEQV